MTQLLNLLDRIRMLSAAENRLKSLLRRGRGGYGVRRRLRACIDEKDALWRDAYGLLRQYHAPENVIYICRQHYYQHDTWLCISAKLYGYTAWNHMMAKRELEGWLKKCS